MNLTAESCLPSQRISPSSPSLVKAFFLCWGGFALLWTTLAFYLHSGFRSFGERWLFDADCYLRLLRVESIFLHGQYPFRSFDLSFPPFGETTPWHLPMDVVIAISGLVACPFYSDWMLAFYHGGIWISPVLFLLTGAVWIALALHVSGIRAAAWVAFLLPLTQMVMNFYFPYRPDHHSLMHLTWSLAFASWLLCFCNKEHDAHHSKYLFFISATASAMAFWISLEGGVWLVFSTAAVGAHIIFENNEENRARTFQLLKRWLFTVVILLSAALAVERGTGLLSAWEWDELSLRHIFAVATGLAAITAAEKLWLHNSFWGRSAAAFCSLAPAMAAWAAGTWAAAKWGRVLSLDEKQMLDFLLSATGDTMPVYRYLEPVLPTLLSWYGMPLFLLPIFLFGWMRTKTIPFGIRLAISGALLFYLPLSFYQIRWNIYASTLLMFIASAGVGHWLNKWEAQRGLVTVGNSAKREVLWLGCLLLLPVAFGGRFLGSLFSSGRVNHTDIAMRSLPTLHGEWLKHQKGLPQNRRDNYKGILAPIAMGPAIQFQWRTGAVGTPYYRNGRGMKQSFEWFLSSDMQKVSSEMTRAGWCYVIVLAGAEAREFREYERWSGKKTNDSSLLRRLSGKKDNWPNGFTLIAETPIKATNGAFDVRLFFLEESSQPTK